jgi:very-short-patch-repair endonuclease
LSESLVVELDGNHHAEAEQTAYDEERTRIFEAGGFRILRFWNNQVQENMSEALEQITKALQSENVSSPSPSGRGGWGVRENTLCKH